MRQLIVKSDQDKNGLVIIEGKDFHYLRQVLRVKNGDMINVCLPDGVLYESTVCKIDDKSKKITLQICGALRQAQGPQVDEQAVPRVFDNIEFTLFQFIPKPQKLDLIVRQATECGVKNIIPVISEYAEKGSIATLQKGKLDRLERIIREARQQSGSPVDTKVWEPVTVEQAVELWNNMKKEAGGEEYAAGFVLSERGVEGDVSSNISSFDRLRDRMQFRDRIQLGDHVQSKDSGAVAIVCGNEGGISPQELELLVKKGLFYPIHFSVNILRCETAALYGIAAVQTGIMGV